MKQWAAEDMDLDTETVEDVLHGLRAFISQILNHKSKQRVIPAVWNSKFKGLWDKLNPDSSCEILVASHVAVAKPTSVNTADLHNASRQSDDEDDDCVEIANPKKRDVYVVDVATDSEDLDVDALKSELFSSADPVLDQILKDGNSCGAKKLGMDRATTRRKSYKQSDGVTCATTMPTEEMEALAVCPSSSSSTSPKAFRDLNVALKAKAKHKKPKPKTKAKAPHTGSKMETTLDNAASWAAFLKREHWKAWSAAKAKAKAAGCTPEKIKEAGSEAGRARMAELRDLLKEGKITSECQSV